MGPITLKDPLTGEIFYPKKISQRYAYPKNRIKHNNLKASQLRQERAFLDKHFHKNHIILREIHKEGRENIFNSNWLEGKGFRTDCITHLFEYRGIQKKCVYEFILIEIEGTDNIKIIKNDRLSKLYNNTEKF
jgi:hypothetical protein